MAKIRIFDGKIDFDNGVFICTRVQFSIYEPSFPQNDEYSEIVFNPQNVEGSYVILDNKQIPFIQSTLSVEHFNQYSSSLSKYMALLMSSKKEVALVEKATNKVILLTDEKYAVDEVYTWVDVPKNKQDEIAIGQKIVLTEGKFEIDNSEQINATIAENASKLKANRENAWANGLIYVDKMAFKVDSQTLGDMSAIKISLLDKTKETAKYSDAKTKKEVEITLKQASEALDKILEYRNKIYSNYRVKKDKIMKEKHIEKLVNFDLSV